MRKKNKIKIQKKNTTFEKKNLKKRRNEFSKICDISPVKFCGLPTRKMVTS